MPEDDAFLSRWSRRKAHARQGQPLPEPAPVPPVPAAPPVPVPSLAAAPVAVDAPEAAVAPPPPPTLDDVARLPPDASDFSRFVARGVQPEVKNAALKKLFADPHFNVMDGLDIYIDDYSKPDPLPASMLRQMVQGGFLGLFDDASDDGNGGGKARSAGTAPDPAPDVPPANAAHPPDTIADTAGDTTAPEPKLHEDADLRLQPHPAAGPDGPAAGAGPGAGREP